MSMSVGSMPLSRTRWATRRAAAVITGEETPTRGSTAGMEYSTRLSGAPGRRASSGRIVMNHFLGVQPPTGQPRESLLRSVLGIARQQPPLQAVALHQPVQRRPVQPRNAGRARYVAPRLRDQLLQEAALEPPEQALAGGAIALGDRVVGVLDRRRAL